MFQTMSFQELARANTRHMGFVNKFLGLLHAASVKLYDRTNQSGQPIAPIPPQPGPFRQN